jgi:hypothetical protein
MDAWTGSIKVQLMQTQVASGGPRFRAPRLRKPASKMQDKAS